MSTNHRTHEHRVKFGIGGMDSMLNGGLVPGRNIVLCGPPGSGKSTFGFHFMQEGVLMSKQPCLYVTLEENKKKLFEDMCQLGINVQAMMQAKQFFFIGGSLAEIHSYMDKVDATSSHLIEEIQEIIGEHGIKRVVIDSLNVFALFCQNPAERRQAVATLCNVLSSLQCTSLLLMEANTHVPEHDIEEFVADGVINLYHFKQGNESLPGVRIQKMRGTKHETQVRPYAITDSGVTVYHEETLFTQ